jgi:RNA polymerase sigma-70 factor (ECF subfamily)
MAALTRGHATLQEKGQESLKNPPHPNDDTPEWSLVERASDGDPDARRELFERYRDQAYRVAFRVTGNGDDALDVVQDSFIKAFESLGEFQRDAGFKTWLLRIVTNRGLDHLRWRKVRLAVPIDGTNDEGPVQVAAAERDPPGAALERQEMAQQVERAMDSLPPEQRAAFALHASGEMTYGQIAEVTGVPIGTVMSRIFHARRRLREALAGLGLGGATPAEGQ